MRVALVHDYLTQLGGAEKVLTSFQRVFPQSPIFVLFYSRAKTGHIFHPKKIQTSWLQQIPLSVNNYQWFLAFMPQAISQLKPANYDLVLSSSSSFAKGVQVPRNVPHVCYCHTPTRYLWHDADSYIKELKYHPFIKKLIPLFLERIKNWDFLAAQQVDYFIANSKTVQDRIRRYYGRRSVVVYPPVDTHKFYITPQVEDYFLIGGRLVAYKRYDLAIQAFNKLGLKLKIFGTGPDLWRLQKMAKENIEFLGNVNEDRKAELYSRAKAFIHPQVEDFGITALESMASGRPVIAYRAGGATETIQQGLTGEFFKEQIWESLAYQLLHFNYKKYDPQKIKSYADRFRTQRFEREIKYFMESVIQDYQLQNVFTIK